MIEKIKLIIGIIMLIFIFLPLGSCDRKTAEGIPSAVEDNSFASETGKEDMAAMESEDNDAQFDYLIPIKEVALNQPLTWLLLLAFMWPLPILAIKKYVAGGKRWKLVVGLLELVCCGFSIYVIYSYLFELFYDPTIWGYLGLIVVSVYFLILIIELLSAGLSARLGESGGAE
jgi:hypothetical protein